MILVSENIKYMRILVKVH